MHLGRKHETAFDLIFIVVLFTLRLFFCHQNPENENALNGQLKKVSNLRESFQRHNIFLMSIRGRLKVREATT